MLARRTLVLLMTVLALFVSACGSDTTSSTPLDDSYAPADSLSDAVTSMLNAEKSNDHNASFALLAPDSRELYKDAADWTTRRNQLPAITAFDLTDSDKGSQTAVVEHTPALDPFKGLSAAKETQVWKGTKFSKGWLLEPDPETTPILPDNEKATAAVTAWVTAVQACDQPKAVQLQVMTDLLATTAPKLCAATGPVTVGAPSTLEEGTSSQAVVDQYSTDALLWARAVPVTSPVSFHVIVAPLGDDWKVLGLY